MAERTEQSKYQIASWTVGGVRIRFAVLSITDTQGNRIVDHERPYREGAKLDDTGGQARQWTFETVWNASVIEDGIDDNGRPLFPDMLRVLQLSFDTHETGDLIVPGVGEVRARALTCSSKEEFGQIDHAEATLVFKQDNEEALDRALLRPPSARATVRRTAEQTTFTAQRNAVWGKQLSGSKGQLSLIQAAEALQDLMLAPGRSVQAVEARARRNRTDIARLIRVQHDIDGQFTSPRGSAAERQLVTLQDRQAQAAGERSRGRPSTVPFVVDVEVTSIYEIAARFDQDAQELIELNDSRIEDPFELRRGTPILVFTSRPRS